MTGSISAEQNQKANDVFDNIEDLIRFIENRIKTESAYDILEFRDYSAQVDLSENAFRVYQRVEEFQRK